MTVLIIIAKILATIMLASGIPGGIFYIWMAQHKPVHGTAVETIAGIIVMALCICGLYFLWFT